MSQPECEKVPPRTYNAGVHVLKAISGHRPNFADRSVCASKFYGLRETIKAARKTCKKRVSYDWASWYGPGFYGRPLAGGGTLGYDTVGVAHKTLPFGTKRFFRFNGRTRRAAVIDRGPYVAGRDWDLTGALARALGFSGVAQVGVSTRNCWAVWR